jgi:signal transduction histidine kinase
METQSAFMAAAAAAVLFGAALFNRRDRKALLFAALTAAFGVFCFGRGAQSLGYPWAASAVGAGLAALGALAPLVAAALIGREELVRRLKPLSLLFIPLLAAAVLAPGLERTDVRGAVEVLAGVWALAGVVGGAALLVHFAPDPAAGDWSEATRMRYLAIAQVVVALAAATDAILWKLDGPRVASLLIPLLYLYAVYLHLAKIRVADLRQLMGNTVALTLMALGLAGSFAVIRIWVGTRLDLFVFNSFVASFALLLLFPSVRSRIQHAMDRYFMASKLELERALGSLADRLTQVRTLDALVKDLLGTLEQIGRLRSSSIFLRDPPHLGFQQAGSIGLPPRKRVNLIRHPAWIEILEQEDALVYDELEKLQSDARSDAERLRLEEICRTMRDLDAELVFGLRAGRDVVGFWTLSDADPREPLSTTEVRLLRSVADQIAISIENSKTFERIRARDRMASLGEMATGLAHEIRNPLATIRGALAVMEDPEAEARGDFHEVIVQEIGRLDRVVGTFLDYARPWTRQAPMHDVEGFVRGCVAAVVGQHPDERVQVAIEVKEEIPPITADADQLERVIMNLINNAYDALEDSGSIRVAVHAGNDAGLEGQVEISVTDNGPGMDETTLERAFIPFFTTKDTGVGLGLALCEKLIRSQGGAIQIQSRPGAGTTVRIRLPRFAPEANEEDAEPGDDS